MTLLLQRIVLFYLNPNIMLLTK